MKIVTLYRYTRSDGGVTDTIFKPDVDYTLRSRLIADKGFILVKGEDKAFCRDEDSIEGWTEVEYIPEEPEEATESDYQEALAKFGVKL